MIIGGDRQFDGEDPKGNSSDAGSTPATSTWLWRRPQVSGLNGSQLIRSRRRILPALVRVAKSLKSVEGQGYVDPGQVCRTAVNPAGFVNGQSLGGASPCNRRLV